MPDTATETSESPEPAREQTRRPEKPPRRETMMPKGDREIAMERCPFAERNSA